MTTKNYAEIVSFESFDKQRKDLGKIVCTSGGFDPLHPGHTTCIIESKQFGDTLVVIVNGADTVSEQNDNKEVHT